MSLALLRLRGLGTGETEGGVELGVAEGGVWGFCAFTTAFSSSFASSTCAAGRPVRGREDRGRSSSSPSPSGPSLSFGLNKELSPAGGRGTEGFFAGEGVAAEAKREGTREAEEEEVEGRGGGRAWLRVNWREADDEGRGREGRIGEGLTVGLSSSVKSKMSMAVEEDDGIEVDVDADESLEERRGDDRSASGCDLEGEEDEDDMGER